ESDLFALGSTLYAAVEGAPPFERETPLATLTAIVSDPPRPCRNAGALAPVLDGLLAKDPQQRLSPDAARDMLAAITHGTDLADTAAWSPPPHHDETRTMPAATSAPAAAQRTATRKRRWPGAVAVVLVVAALGG